MPKQIIKTKYTCTFSQKSWGKQKICHKLDWTPSQTCICNCVYRYFYVCWIVFIRITLHNHIFV